ncbi:MAG TPA: dihydropteroate synthase [Candidatus Marinimicrobia bacterium]|jgi:dihydropteroate synthase|nr:dihydropteroate synthase [Candidatus Neomarinimicrobiota bacterium]MDP6143313.1 dihydropteroate synthase [Candidatus Neomarinimicrobiota bacterium]MDP6260607.1 dihydropteroate synthase [Candidatus Neomarinimicrobiota bacterium]MDP7127419.1 dihydropteroate synthase [Candidatus Neomarinimicrobiota bacterium]MDP7337365.1 dihydropteroate synthase [Candidatus Neomarinimicrobiota bacterium]|tara:strand:+ start:13564 stop:14403 length:840 start_codon:yes stop_codon:yes gene_type:complete
MNAPRFNQWIREENPATLIMGILNVTPDSFSDGGMYCDATQAIDFALQMAEEGADIIDVGGESTRPGAKTVELQKECDRILPVIEGIRTKSDILISIDTYKSEVARQSIATGAGMVNDISGMTFDPNMVDVIKDSGLPVVIMHIKGTPKNMQKNPYYEDLMQELTEYFEERKKFARAKGILDQQIILDPGIGFGKRLQDNFQLLRELKKIVDMGFPVLIGPSRKSFIGLTLDLPVDQRLEGTAAAVTTGILKGARIVRVHDVKAMKRVALITDSIRGIA